MTTELNGGTWLQAEELAYDVSLTNSPRRARVRCPDGRLRVVTCGIPDTYFSIPARAKVNGTTVGGFVHMDTEKGEFRFTPYVYRKNWDAFRVDGKVAL